MYKSPAFDPFDIFRMTNDRSHAVYSQAGRDAGDNLLILEEA